MFWFFAQDLALCCSNQFFSLYHLPTGLGNHICRNETYEINQIRTAPTFPVKNLVEAWTVEVFLECSTQPWLHCKEVPTHCCYCQLIGIFDPVMSCRGQSVLNKRWRETVTKRAGLVIVAVRWLGERLDVQGELTQKGSWIVAFLKDLENSIKSSQELGCHVPGDLFDRSDRLRYIAVTTWTVYYVYHVLNMVDSG